MFHFNNFSGPVYYGSQIPIFSAAFNACPALQLGTFLIDFSTKNGLASKLLIKWSWIRVPAGSPYKSSTYMILPSVCLLEKALQ
jgi:hypothetical protein